MNFKDILDKWEKTNRIYDKDIKDKPFQISPQQKRRLLLSKKPEAKLDIHGLNRSEAWQMLEVFFNESKKKGFDKILIIHGKGNHSSGETVLKRVVLEFIEHCPFAGESGRGKAASGGEGGTWVLLKPSKSKR
jgi:DNA-nicking Smr family endonuclease